jgi:uncharacterized protein (TIGR02217 family)
MLTFAPPIGITYPIKRRPMFSTLKQPSISGKDNPIQLWAYPRYHYELPFSFLRADVVNAELQYMMGFYNSVGGAAQTWLYADPVDGAPATGNGVTNQTFGTGDGSTTKFGLVRARGGFVEPVFAPVTATVHIFDNGVDQAGNFTLGTSGLVTFTVAPLIGHALTWTGNFNWIVRFDDDQVDFDQQPWGVGGLPLWEAKKFVFTTVPVTFA